MEALKDVHGNIVLDVIHDGVVLENRSKRPRITQEVVALVGCPLPEGLKGCNGATGSTPL